MEIRPRKDEQGTLGGKDILAAHHFVSLRELKVAAMWDVTTTFSLIFFQELAVGPQQIPMLNSGSRWTWETEWRLQQWPRREDTEALTG